jgi:hypothetical protein
MAVEDYPESLEPEQARLPKSVAEVSGLLVGSAFAATLAKFMKLRDEPGPAVLIRPAFDRRRKS